MTIQELYDSAIKNRPFHDQLELVKLIVGQMPPESIVDFSSEWSNEDLVDVRRHAVHLMEKHID